ncbi:MAG: hypothetical protein CMJ42_21035 [Phyllobacteriaceae bacterium]|nr:hypothetical protein [Phyllobacteriaceae bacterium]MBA90821.1 hypothetical protein [Phyllobacteriaceae bacterium]
MDNQGSGGGSPEASNLVALHDIRRQRHPQTVTFHRTELSRILNIYSFMVAANEWRDYAIDHLSDRAVFSVFKRSSEAPLFQIIKEPKRAARQGAWSVVNAAGVTLKRGHELDRVLAVFDKPLKLVKG